jgi:hypothetical protein
MMERKVKKQVPLALVTGGSVPDVAWKRSMNMTSDEKSLKLLSPRRSAGSIFTPCYHPCHHPPTVQLRSSIRPDTTDGEAEAAPAAFGITPSGVVVIMKMSGSAWCT